MNHVHDGPPQLRRASGCTRGWAQRLGSVRRRRQRRSVQPLDTAGRLGCRAAHSPGRGVPARRGTRRVRTPPSWRPEGIPRHRVLHEPGAIVFDDVYDNFYPQALQSVGLPRAHGVRARGVLQRGDRGGRRQPGDATRSSTGRGGGSSGGQSCSTWSGRWPKRGVLTTQAPARRSPWTIWSSPAVGPVSTSAPGDIVLLAHRLRGLVPSPAGA